MIYFKEDTFQDEQKSNNLQDISNDIKHVYKPDKERVTQFNSRCVFAWAMCLHMQYHSGLLGDQFWDSYQYL